MLLVSLPLALQLQCLKGLELRRIPAYGTYFFEMANIGNAFQNSCILVAIGVVVILVNSAIITKYGRRRIFLIVGLVLCGITQLILAAVYTAKPGTVTTGKVIVGLSVLYIIGYNGCISSYAWLSGGEIPSQRLRSMTFGLAAAVGFFGAWLTTFTAPYFINPDSLNWGPKVRIPFAQLSTCRPPPHRPLTNITAVRIHLGALVLRHRAMGLLLFSRSQRPHA
jgi:Sugar (and other) transporter